MQADLIIRQPIAIEAAADAAELVLLFHGVGSSAEDLQPLGEALASRRPGAWVVSVRSPHPSDFGHGWQWFSVQGVTETNRPERVAAALPAFAERVGAWQRHAGVGPERTTLIGFSQGAIMALESTQHPGLHRLASRVVAVAGRFAQPPRRAPNSVMLHLMHGDRDGVMPIGFAVDADRRLRALGAASTLERFPGLGHGIDARVVTAIARRLAEPAPLGSAAPATWLHIGDEELVVRSGPDGQLDAQRTLDLGASRIARDFFRHDPPTAHEIEQAIDFVEDQIMRLGPRRDAGAALRSSSEILQPWAAVSGATVAVEIVEQWFERLALAAQGRVGALDGFPPGREAAAALVVLREFMHHRGHPSIAIVEPRQALVDGLAAA
jgi:phospholipase/carboxylesterase